MGGANQIPKGRVVGNKRDDKAKAADGHRPATRKDEIQARKEETQARMAVRIMVISSTEKVLRVVCLGATVCVVAYFAFKAVETAAGRTTDFRSIIEWSAKLGVSEWIAWACAAVAGGGWWKERRARQKMATQAGPRLEELENAADPGRASSGLRPDGTNPPEDGI